MSAGWKSFTKTLDPSNPTHLNPSPAPDPRYAIFMVNLMPLAAKNKGARKGFRCP